MDLVCPNCPSQDFTLPLWVTTTFTFNTDGTLSLVHVQPLEALEEKLTEQATGMPEGITCLECGSQVKVHFNPYESATRATALRNALEDL